jgi:hypothetical protein
MLAACRHFSLEALRIRETGQTHRGRPLELLTSSPGWGCFQQRSRKHVELSKGGTVLLPAALGGYGIEAPAGLIVLRSRIPDLAGGCGRPIAAEGFSGTQIEPLAGPRRPNDLDSLAVMPPRLYYCLQSASRAESRRRRI